MRVRNKIYSLNVFFNQNLNYHAKKLSIYVIIRIIVENKKKTTWKWISLLAGRSKIFYFLNELIYFNEINNRLEINYRFMYTKRQINDVNLKFLVSDSRGINLKFETKIIIFPLHFYPGIFIEINFKWILYFCFFAWIRIDDA